MNEKFNKNANVEKFTNMLGIAVRLIVIDPLYGFLDIFQDFISQKAVKNVIEPSSVRQSI